MNVLKRLVGIESTYLLGPATLQDLVPLRGECMLHIDVQAITCSLISMYGKQEDGLWGPPTRFECVI